jgi:thiol-disulfide isomerase/thioredoxin
MQINRLTLAVMALLACLPVSASTLTASQPAPALTFTDLLQAPVGQKTDWPSLRGKVVVLEFWATWCAGCVEQIPHLNDLIQSLDPAKVQFIAVDDEEPAVVKKFIEKTPIHGWLGLDTSKKLIDVYDAQVRPRTVVVDAQGRITAILNPDQLTREQLLALSDGKPVAFPVDEMAGVREQALKQAKEAAAKAETGTEASKPLFDIAIRPGDPAGKTTMVHKTGKNDDSYAYDVLNAPLPMLLQYAAGIAGSRLTVREDKGEKYSLHVAAPGGEIEELAPSIQQAIVTATGRKLSRVTAIEDAYVLQPATPATSQAAPATDGAMSFCFYNPRNGKVQMMNSSLDSLASSLEDALGLPVVNEAGRTGTFSLTFDLPKGDVQAAQAALEKNLGLTLVKAKRSIERVVLEAPSAKPVGKP